MLKKMKCMAAMSFCLLATSFTQAGMIVDVVEQNEYVGWWGSHSYTHDITDQGFSLGSADSGTLAIELSDDKDKWYEFGGEVVLFIVDSFDLDTGGFTFGSAFSGDLELSALGAINANGMLDITVQSVVGDFYVGNSTLTVNTVPEPGALALFSLGLLGLGLSRRRAK